MPIETERSLGCFEYSGASGVQYPASNITSEVTCLGEKGIDVSAEALTHQIGNFAREMMRKPFSEIAQPIMSSVWDKRRSG